MYQQRITFLIRCLYYFIISVRTIYLNMKSVLMSRKGKYCTLFLKKRHCVQQCRLGLARRARHRTRKQDLSPYTCSLIARSVSQTLQISKHVDDIYKLPFKAVIHVVNKVDSYYVYLVAMFSSIKIMLHNKSRRFTVDKHRQVFTS